MTTNQNNYACTIYQRKTILYINSYASSRRPTRL